MSPFRPPRSRLLLYFSLTCNIFIGLLILDSGYRKLPSKSIFESISAVSGGYDVGSGYFGLGQAGGEGRCGLCSADDGLCERIGRDGVKKSIGYEGSGHGMKRFLEKRKRGEPFTLGVIGGSVSKGHGLDLHNFDTLNDPLNLNRRIFDHLNLIFPAENGISIGSSGRNEGKNSFVNGALGGTGTDYFSLCFGEHIPEDVDLVLIELSINDELLMQNLESYELLVRGLMDLPNKPTIINLQVFALMFGTIALGGDLHAGISQYYDLPTISARHALLPTILANASDIRQWFHNKDPVPMPDYSDVDTRHLSWQGHEVLADLTNAWIDTQLCQLHAASEEEREGLMIAEELPRLRLLQSYDATTVTPALRPNCFSTSSKNHPLVPKTNNGWREWAWEEKKYLIADQPGSTLTISFSTVLGTVQLQALHSKAYGLGTVSCWVDRTDGKARAEKIDAYWDLPYNIGRSHTIRDDLSPGEHTLTCELLDETKDPVGGKEFRIISVMSI